MIYGIGLPTSKKLLEKFSIPLNKRVKDITEDEQKLLGDHMKDNMVIESDLRREVGNSIKRLKEIRCYRGMRHNM
jgi:small subunit ribosomal protein S13